MERVSNGFFRVDTECDLRAVVAASEHKAFARYARASGQCTRTDGTWHAIAANAARRVVCRSSLGLANRDYYRACRPDRQARKQGVSGVVRCARKQGIPKQARASSKQAGRHVGG